MNTVNPQIVQYLNDYVFEFEIVMEQKKWYLKTTDRKKKKGGANKDGST